MWWLTLRSIIVAVAVWSFLWWFVLSLFSPMSLSSHLLPISSTHSNVVNVVHSHHFPREYYELFDIDNRNEGKTEILEISNNRTGKKNLRTNLFTGNGVRIVIIDSGLSAHYTEFSHNRVSCVSVVPNVSCESRGYVHGTDGVSVMAGNVETYTNCYRTSRSSHNKLWKWANHFTSLLLKIFIRIGIVREEAKHKWEAKRFVGIAPDAEVQVIRVFDSHGETTSSYILDALLLAKQALPHIVSLPHGRRFSSRANHSKITDAINALLECGVLVFAAAGNGGSDDNVHYPASLTGVVAMGALRASKILNITYSGNRANLIWQREQKWEPQGSKIEHFYEEWQQQLQEEWEKDNKLLMQTFTKYRKAVSPFSSGAKLFVGERVVNLDEVEHNKQIKPNVYALGEGVIAISSFRLSDEHDKNDTSRGTVMALAQFIMEHVNNLLHLFASTNKNSDANNRQAGNNYIATLDLVDGTSIATSIAAGIAALYVEEYLIHDIDQTYNLPCTSSMSVIIKKRLMDNALRYRIASSDESSLCADINMPLLTRKTIRQHYLLPVHNNNMNNKSDNTSLAAVLSYHCTVSEIFPPHSMQQQEEKLSKQVFT